MKEHEGNLFKNKKQTNNTIQKFIEIDIFNFKVQLLARLTWRNS